MKRKSDETEGTSKKPKSLDIFSICEEILSDSKLFEEDIKKFEGIAKLKI